MGNKRYPINIQSEMRRESATKSDKKQALIYACFIGVGCLAVAIYMILKSLFNVSLGVSILVSIIVSLIIFLFVFKHFIFKEDEKLKKLQKQNSETFARFYSLGKDVSSRVKLPNKQEIPIFEYKDGNNAFVLEFKFGSNSNQSSVYASYKCLESVFNFILQAGFICEIVVCPEKFTTSDEYKSYINKISTAGVDKSYTQTMLKLMKHMTEHSAMSTGTSTINLIIRTKMTYQKYSMSNLMHTILDTVWSYRTGFRSVKFLDGMQFRDFMTRFYGLGAIDLSKYESTELDLALKEKYYRIVRLYSTTSHDGETVNYDVFGNTFKNNAREVR